MYNMFSSEIYGEIKRKKNNSLKPEDKKIDLNSSREFLV